jgi:hypothetical protein
MRTTLSLPALILLVLLAGCGAVDLPSRAADPTIDAVATQSAILNRVHQTQTARPPMPTPLPSATLVAVRTPTATPTASTRAKSGLSPRTTLLARSTVTPKATVCVYGASFVRDATIPDGTRVDPGQVFTKVWVIQNSGNCSWATSFGVGSVDDPSTPATPLRSVARPGDTVEISMGFQAPMTGGVVRSTWRMRDATGRFFGDAFYLEVVVDVPATAPPPPTDVPPPEHQRPDAYCGYLQVEMQAENAYHRDRMIDLLERGDVHGITKEGQRHERQMQYLQGLYNLYCGT